MLFIDKHELSCLFWLTLKCLSFCLGIFAGYLNVMTPACLFFICALFIRVPPPYPETDKEHS